MNSDWSNVQNVPFDEIVTLKYNTVRPLCPHTNNSLWQSNNHFNNRAERRPLWTRWSFSRFATIVNHV